MGCSIAGIIDEKGNRFSGEKIICAIKKMYLRANGLGGGFAGYGIYPDNFDDFCFHIIYNDEKARENTESYLKHDFEIVKEEPIPTRTVKSIVNRPLLFRYFLRVKDEIKKQFYEMTEEDIVMRSVMKINGAQTGAFVISSGKNMGIFKGVGFAADIGKFYKLEEYSGYCWIAHDRFPTNTPVWELRRDFSDVKIIAISGGGAIGAETYLQMAKSMGAHRVFGKPFQLQEMLEAIRELVDG